MALIFVGSTDLLSQRRTSRFIGPFLRWIHPGVSDETIRQVQILVRKGGHVTEYAVLAILACRALARMQAGPGGNGDTPPRRPWLAALLLSAAYAATDEYHQSFVATRAGQVTDVLIDTAGAAAGLAVLWLWDTWRQSRRRSV